MASGPTLADVARKAKVAPTTASKVLNGLTRKYRIRAATEERIHAAAQNLGYRPNFHSRAFRGGSTRTVGFIVRNDVNANHSGSPIVAEFLSGVNTCLVERSMMLALVQPPCLETSDGNESVILAERCLDGAIVFYGLRGLALRNYESQRLPTIWLDSDERKPTNCVYRDEAESYRLAAEYLLELGHRHIAFLEPVVSRDGEWHISSVLAGQGYRAAMKDAGLPEIVVPFSPGDPDHEKVVRCALNMNPKPTAFVTPRAEHTYHVLLKMGLRVPDDASVVTCAYRTSLQLMMGGMTEVTFDRHLIGWHAARMLCELIRTGKDQPSFVFRSKIVPGDTTKRIGASLLTAERTEFLLGRIAQ